MMDKMMMKMYCEKLRRDIGASEVVWQHYNCDEEIQFAFKFGDYRCGIIVKTVDFNKTPINITDMIRETIINQMHARSMGNSVENSNIFDYIEV